MKFAPKVLAAAAIAAACLGTIGSARAYTFTVKTANQNGVAFDALPTTTLNNPITANFTYTGPLNFANNSAQNSTSTGDLNSAFFSVGTISNYSGSGSLGSPANANFTNLASFLASSGSASNFQYGSLYTIDLGTLAAGTVLTITHDDGASVYQNGVRQGTTTAGPTTAITESVRLRSTADTILYYARENGAPSVLNVAVPEPVSFAMLGTGLAGLALLRRRRAAVAAA